ncbi:MAG: deoxyribonuclease V [Chloroflexota bacterium]
MNVKVHQLHRWQLSTAEALGLQRRLASQVSRDNEVVSPRFIAGVDISVGNEERPARAAVVVLSYPGLSVVETRVVEGKLTFPYIPGLLSFRELPLALLAFAELCTTPDLILVDGAGVAHPRRFGLASHLGLWLDTPTIGCAKSRLCGSHEMPELESGSFAEITDKNEVIGVALRTRHGVKPVYVSLGHRVDLASTIHWVLQCCRGYRLPEPTRLAHQAAGGKTLVAAESGL